MILPFYSISELAKEILRICENYPGLTDMEMWDLNLCAKAWEQRTGRGLSFKEFDIIKEVYGCN